MKQIHDIDRSNSMEDRFNVTDPQKSGKNLTYNTHVGGLVIGRMYPSTYQHIMPADKFSAKNVFSFTAEQLSTPVISDIEVSQHNFFVTYRSIDKGFEDLLTPTKLNGMSAGLSAPSLTLRTIVQEIATYFKDFLPYYVNGDISFSNTYVNDFTQINLISTIRAFASSYAKDSYLDDVYEDLIQQLEPIRSVIYGFTSSTPQNEIENAFILFWSTLFDFFCGEGSNMDYLGYPIMEHESTKTWLTQIAFSALQNQTGTPDPADDGTYVYGNLMVDSRLQNEYALRALYAIWFEHYRVQELEPRSANLWEYHDFGSTPLFSGSTLDKAIATLLPLRVRSWSKDAFTTAQIDDISRHVYAPILNNTVLAARNLYSSPSEPAQDNVSDNAPYSNTGNLWSSTTVTYTNTDGVTNFITCPLPDALSRLDVNKSFVSLGANSYTLDLFTIKKAKMLENYLKRNLAFGDEYRDRMKAHYNVTIEDYRINRPVYLKGSVSLVDMKQEVANTGAVEGSTMNQNGIAAQGTRLATATVNNEKQSDGFEFFATEFGIYISLLSFVPRSQFDYTCPQNSMIKTMDFPSPEFAMQQEDIMNASEMYRNGVYNKTIDNKPFGHVPYAHGYRYRVDEVHGQMLSSKFDYTFCRFYQGLTSDGIPKLNYKFLHCRPNIPMFTNQILLDGQFYGSHKHNFFVERLLPEPVDVI